MASFGSYYCSDCNVSFPYPSKFKRHLETRKHQLLEAIEDAATHNAREQMELDTNSDAGEQKSDFHCENVEQLAWSDVSYLIVINFYCDNSLVNVLLNPNSLAILVRVAVNWKIVWKKEHKVQHFIQYVCPPNRCHVVDVIIL